MGADAESRFRVGFVPGVTPDRWARLWAERMPRRPLDLVPLGDLDPVALLRTRELAMCLVRLPVDTDGLHLIRLYDEQPVVVVAAEHPVAAYDEVDVRDLADEHLLQDPDEVPAWRDVAAELADGSRFPVPPMALREAVESVAADAGVLVLPMSLARLHHRRDVVAVRVTGVPVTTVGLVWPREVVDDRLETFVGVVRGRTARSSRGSSETVPEIRPKQPKPRPKQAVKPARQAGRGGRGGRPAAGSARGKGSRRPR